MYKQPRGGAAGDLFFFIFFLIVLGIIWALTGGPDRSISTSGPFLSNPFGKNDTNNVPGVTIPENVDTDSSSNSPLPGELLSTERASPYAGTVQLTSARAKNSTAAGEYLKIQTSDDVVNPISIASWRIESTVSGDGTTLRNVAELPYSGQVNTETPLFLYPDATIYVITGRSPIGSSFRTNLCTGYFIQHQTFEPSLRKDCPLPEDELARAVDDGMLINSACSDFVEDMNRCELTTDAVPSTIGSECRNFIQNTLTYSGCVRAHSNTPGFYSNEWRVYLNRDQELWKNSKDRIRLVDENGFVVDVVSY